MTAKKEKEIKGLVWLQANLNAPKNQFNSFGKYSYRSCEDILAALKPLLSEAEATLTISDEIVLVGDRFYVKATASLATVDGNIYQVNAFAREPVSKKGMDESQITGAASSYARKYALNGLFAIDDTKDADATNDHGKGNNNSKPAPPPPEVNHKEIADRLLDEIEKVKNIQELAAWWKANVKAINAMPFSQKGALIGAKENLKKKFASVIKEEANE